MKNTIHKNIRLIVSMLVVISLAFFVFWYINWWMEVYPEYSRTAGSRALGKGLAIGTVLFLAACCGCLLLVWLNQKYKKSKRNVSNSDVQDNDAENLEDENNETRVDAPGKCIAYYIDSRINEETCAELIITYLKEHAYQEIDINEDDYKSCRTFYIHDKITKSIDTYGIIRGNTATEHWLDRYYELVNQYFIDTFGEYVPDHLLLVLVLISLGVENDHRRILRSQTYSEFYLNSSQMIMACSIQCEDHLITFSPRYEPGYFIWGKHKKRIMNILRNV